MRNLDLKKNIAILCASFLLISFSGCGKNVDTDIATFIDNKLDIICSPTSSSNPYDYTKGSKDFDDIVNMGDDALKYMLTKFKSSKENGLKEYVMAIACSEILKENPENKKWATGRGWYENYIKANKFVIAYHIIFPFLF